MGIIEKRGNLTWADLYLKPWSCGKNHLLNKVVKVQKADEQDELKKQKVRIRQLEKALADAHLDSLIEKEYFKMVCEAANIDDPEEFKKKLSLR